MTLKLDHDSSTPLYKQAEALLRQMIKEEDYMNGKLFPNEVELSKKLGISRNTLRQAITNLTYEGLLIRKKGYGTTVAPSKVMGNARNWMSFSQEMQALGVTVQNFELHLSWKKASKECADFMNIPEGARVLCLERLRGKPEHPFVYFVSYFHPDIHMTGEEDMNKPLYDMLAEKYGVKAKISRELISAQKVDGFLAEKLEISEGDPILLRKRFVYDDQSLPIEYNIGYYRADSFSYSIEFVND